MEEYHCSKNNFFIHTTNQQPFVKALTLNLCLSPGDLTISVNVLYNYLEANSKVPWEDLRYLFGEIMYGGHITDDWDRVLCRTYLEEYLHPDQVQCSEGSERLCLSCVGDMCSGGQ